MKNTRGYLGKTDRPALGARAGHGCVSQARQEHA
jgi:hypothetical protein